MNGKAWMNLAMQYCGNDKEVRVEGHPEKMNAVSCYAEACYATPQDPKTWLHLGMFVQDSIEVNKTKYTKKDLILKALQLDSTDCVAWLWLGCIMDSGDDVVVCGSKYDKLACLVEAVTYDPDDKNPEGKKYLLEQMDDGDVVTIRGEEYKKDDGSLVPKTE